MIYTGLSLAIIIFAVLFLVYRTKYLKERKKHEEADMLLTRWNVKQKEEILTEKQKKRKTKI